MFIEFAVHKQFQSSMTLLKINCSADDMSVNPCSHLPWDLVMRWSSNWGCHHFLSFVFCLCAFCFQFCNLQLLSKCRYMLTVWLGKVACSRSCYWDCVLCRLTGKYHWSVWQGIQFLVSVLRRPILLPDMVSLGFGFKLSFFWKACKFHSQTGCYRL